MDIGVNGTRLWFDVDGPALVPDGSEMRQRPTVVLVHGGPGVCGARHPGHAAGLVVQSGFARWDTPRMVEGFRRLAGDEVAEIAGRSYAGEPVPDEEWARVFSAFGPRLPDDQREAHAPKNLELNARGMEFMGRLGDLPEGIGQLEVIDGARNFTWMDAPER